MNLHSLTNVTWAGGKTLKHATCTVTDVQFKEQ